MNNNNGCIYSALGLPHEFVRDQRFLPNSVRNWIFLQLMGVVGSGRWARQPISGGMYSLAGVRSVIKNACPNL